MSISEYNKIKFDKLDKPILDLSKSENINIINNMCNEPDNRKRKENFDLLLDTQIILFTDDLEILKIFDIKPNNLYSFNKIENKDIKTLNIEKKPISNNKKYKTLGGNVNELTTFHNNISNTFEMNKIRFYINYFQINRIHFPITYTDGKKYYIEFTSYPDRKLIIAVCTDRNHRNEIIHLSLFLNSYFHITVVRGNKHYKLYHTINPNIVNKYENIIEIINYSIILFNNDDMIYDINWNNSINNNWHEIIFHRSDQVILINKVKRDLEILNYVIKSLKNSNFMFLNTTYFNGYINYINTF